MAHIILKTYDLKTFTPLMLNVLENKIEQKNLQNINAQDSQEHTALHIACMIECSNKLIKKLLENGADPNIQDDSGSTALMKIVLFENTDNPWETVKILLDYGTNPNLQTNNGGHTALMTAIHWYFHNKNLKIIELLLQYGADPNIQDDGGYRESFTPLMEIVREHIKLNLKPEVSVIKILLENGAKLDGLKEKELAIIAPIQKEIIERLKSELDLKPGYPGAHQAEERFRRLQGKPRRRSNSL